MLLAWMQAILLADIVSDYIGIAATAFTFLATIIASFIRKQLRNLEANDKKLFRYVNRLDRRLMKIEFMLKVKSKSLDDKEEDDDDSGEVDIS